MLTLLATLAAASVAAAHQEWHSTVDRSPLAHVTRDSPVNTLCVSSGAPVPYCQANVTISGSLMRNTYFMDLMTSQAREKTLGRTVHTTGSGAMGYFEVTHDISHICKADFLNEIGKKTPVAVRFSPATAERGSIETGRGVFGFAIKFYTEKGNFDLPGVNMPSFFTKDPAKFTQYVYTLRKEPSLYLPNAMGLWDRLVEYPESLNMFMVMFGDRGMPASYRCMPCHNIHTLQVENEEGEQHFIRWHFKPDAGIKNLKTAQSADPDYYTRDLFEAIKKGDFPSWTVSVQIVSEDDLKRCGHSKIFDVTRTLPEKEFPLHPVGKMVLNRNPTNYFLEIEQLAFGPANMVEGIHGSPDEMYQARIYAYKDAQRTRLGRDVNQIPVNCPLNMPDFDPNTYEYVYHEPNHKKGLLQIIEEEPYNSDQVTEYYDQLTCKEKTNTINTIISMLAPAKPTVQKKVIHLFTKVHHDLGRRIERGLNAMKNHK